MSTRPSPLARAPANLASWVRVFDPAALPVLAETTAALELWRAAPDALDARRMGETLGQDPLMTLKLLAHVASLRRRRDRDESGAETVTEALVMLGIDPFFRVFGPQPVVETWLAGHADAPGGFARVLRRSHRAAMFALAFAAHRMDTDAAVIHEAALLHDFAELLLWLHAPALATEIAARQRAEPGLRSAQAQAQTLNVELAALQHELMQRWGLPSLLVRMTDDRLLADPQVRNVLLAIRVARHSADGWDDPALPDDVRDVGSLLQLGEGPVQRLLADIDAAA